MRPCGLLIRLLYPSKCEEFRQELVELQRVLRLYTKMLADMAGVEDLTEFEGDEI